MRSPDTPHAFVFCSGFSFALSFTSSSSFGSGYSSSPLFRLFLLPTIRFCPDFTLAFTIKNSTISNTNATSAMNAAKPEMQVEQ